MDDQMDLKVYESLGRSSFRPCSRPCNGCENFSDVLARAFSGGETGYDSYFEAAAAAYQLPVGLLKAVGKVESAFTADVVSPCGAQGVMQLMPSTARALGVRNPFDPAQNIMGGAKYLRQMLDRFGGNVSMALAAYNAGPGAVEQYGGIPPYRETQNYVSKVLSSIGDPSFSPAPSSVAQLPSPDSKDTFLSGEDLAGMIQQVVQSGGTMSQKSVRFLLDQLLSRQEDEERPLPGEIL